MNKAELKQLLKPLIKECIKEVIFEDGVLSGIVSEVSRGLKAPTLVEAKEPQPRVQKESFTQMHQESAKEHKQKLNEHKQKLNEHRQQLRDAIGKGAYNGVNLFEGTSPMTGAPAPGAAPTVQGPFANIAPDDAGVDISSLTGGISRRWKAHMDAGK